MNRDYEVVTIGRPYHPDRDRWPENYEYNYRNGQHEIRLFLRSPTNDEIDSIQRGPASFALPLHSSEAGLIIVLCARFGAMEWCDMTYSWHLIPPADRTLPDPQHAGEHALLTTILVDAGTGIVRALRACTLSAEFTDAMEAAIFAQSRQPFDPAAWQAAVSELYQAHTTNDLVNAAVVRCRGGD